ncbi:MAG TPA: SpoIIE family protein phosphatase [Ktedonobacterales bacterium]|nr:SpoIIE family protein phosphatase [Ktedonobacterales bacterium]
MSTFLQRFRRGQAGQQKGQLERLPTADLAQALAQNGVSLEDIQRLRASVSKGTHQKITGSVEIAPNDPIVAYFLSAPGAVEIDKLHLDSPALRALKAAGVKLAVPLVSQGELVGLLNLGPRMSEQDYSAYDRGLLNSLATQAAPAVRVAQLVREQQAAIRTHERIEQELRVARVIQHTLLPKELPALPGWQVAAYYQPARAVGGDFYDFLYFEDGRLGIVIGDVTDKGVPAALVMATTRSILRSAAQAQVTPGKALEQANDQLCPDIPPKMFVTCLYAILDPATGRLQYANAGHDLPYRHQQGSTAELRATGMPLGLLPGMTYEEKETILAPGERVLFYSDGLVEAHNPTREMFGFPRLMGLLAEQDGTADEIDFLLKQLADFTGPDWEQEDDVTLVTLHHLPAEQATQVPAPSRRHSEGLADDATWLTLAHFSLPSEPGNERQAMEQVAEVAQKLDLSPRRLEQLKTAVAEATMNAMEHGNRYRPDMPVQIQVAVSGTMLSVRITDQGGTQPIPEATIPDLEAKLAELQTPRGWGLFLIQNLVDEMNITSDETHHTIELILHLEGGDSDASEHA